MCGRSAYEVDEVFLDIKRDIDDFGCVYFCLECGQEIGIAAYCVPGHKHQAVVEDYERVKEENTRQNSMIERLGDGLERDILDYLSNRRITTGVPAVDRRTSDDVSAEQPGNDQLQFDVVSSTERATGKSESESSGVNPEFTEPSSVDGPNDSVESTGGDSDSFLYNPSIEL